MPTSSPRWVFHPLPVEVFKCVPVVWPTPVLIGSRFSGGNKKGSNNDRRGEACAPQNIVATTDYDLRWVPPGLSGCVKAARPKLSVKSSDEDHRWVPPWPSKVRNRVQQGISSLPGEKPISMEASSWSFATVRSEPMTTSQMHSKVTIGRLFDLEEIVSAGGRTIWGNPAEIGSVLGGETFDVVLDNNGKDLDAVRPVIDWAKSSGTKQFLFISSAGIYKPTDEPPHVEGDVVKADAGHVGVEKYIEETFGGWAVFRPQYMIGSGNNKDCEEWFFDRIVRDRPVPIPGSGLQLTNISHVRDLSSMLTLAVEKPEAANHSIFNCVSDRAVTLVGMAKLCAQAAQRPVNIVLYDPKALGVDAKKAFPFRNMHFYAEPRAAKEKLGWTSSTNLPGDLKERFDEYVKIGRDKKDIKFELDDKILESLKVPVPT